MVLCDRHLVGSVILEKESLQCVRALGGDAVYGAKIVLSKLSFADSLVDSSERTCVFRRDAPNKPKAYASLSV